MEKINKLEGIYDNHTVVDGKFLPEFKLYHLDKIQIYTYFLHSMEKKSTFLSYCVKNHHSTLEMDTFKIMLLLGYLASLDNKPRT